MVETGTCYVEVHTIQYKISREEQQAHSSKIFILTITHKLFYILHYFLTFIIDPADVERMVWLINEWLKSRADR